MLVDQDENGVRVTVQLPEAQSLLLNITDEGVIADVLSEKGDGYTHSLTFQELAELVVDLIEKDFTP